MSTMQKATRYPSNTHVSAHIPAKKMERVLQSQPPVTTVSAQKRKRSADEGINDAAPTAPTKKLKTSPKDASESTPLTTTTATRTPGSKSTLIPRGTRRKATIGIKDETLLRMVCDCTTTLKVTELHFRKIPHSLIDWNSAHHISKINAWRNQIYGRAGLKARSVSLWYEAEEFWFELYYQLSIVESRKRGIMLPASKQVRDAFNETFVGSVIKDKTGEDLPPRVAREGNAFASKFNRMFPLLRARLNSCVIGRSGDVFIPKITFEMMDRYKGMKKQMEDQGIHAESEYADALEEWQYFLSHLPDGEDVEMQDQIKEEDERDMEEKESDAVAALMCLANSTVNAQAAHSPAVGVSCAAEASNEQATPELTRSNRTSFSQAVSESPSTPPQHTAPFEGRAYDPDSIYGCGHDSIDTCEQTPDPSPSIRAHGVDMTN